MTKKEIENTLSIPLSTLKEWERREDYRHILLGMIKSLTPKELEALLNRTFTVVKRCQICNTPLSSWTIVKEDEPTGVMCGKCFEKYLEEEKKEE